MIPPEYQVGQIVEYNGTFILLAKEGARAIIVAIHNREGQYIDVKWIRNRLSSTQSDGGYFPESFTIVEMAPRKQLNFLLKNRIISNLQYLEALHKKPFTTLPTSVILKGKGRK